MKGLWFGWSCRVQEQQPIHLGLTGGPVESQPGGCCTVSESKGTEVIEPAAKILYTETALGGQFPSHHPVFCLILAYQQISLETILPQKSAIPICGAVSFPGDIPTL